ncbi:hypothetical protein ERJ75_000558500 [Trypanosoma vivax]|nr:hypothetical protein ERJ75_000558500 [Trypanosoma vivax]
MAAFGRGVICLVDSVNGRDPGRPVGPRITHRTAARWRALGPNAVRIRSGPSLRDSLHAQGEMLGNSRSVMLLDALGDTRTTMSVGTRHAARRARLTKRAGKHRNHVDTLGTEYCNYWSRNEECLVGAAHQTAPITSLPFVHTARRCFRCWRNTGDWTAGRLARGKFTDIASLEEAKVVTR